jgi:BON domain
MKEEAMQRKPFPISLLVVALALAVSAACRPAQTLERQTDDAGIKTRIKAKLAKDVGASTITAVEVNVTNGVVTLAGPVSSAQDRMKIEAAARSVEGVVSVTNNIQVTASPAAAPQPATSSMPAAVSAPATTAPPLDEDKPKFVAFPTPTPVP